MRILIFTLLAITILAPSASAQMDEIHWWLNWSTHRTNLDSTTGGFVIPDVAAPAVPSPTKLVEATVPLPAPRLAAPPTARKPVSAPSQKLAAPTITRPAPVVIYPTQIRQGLQQNSYIDAAPEKTIVVPFGAGMAPLRLIGSPTLKETESRIVRRLCTEYKRGLTPGELDELARNLMEKNRRYLGDKAQNPYEYYKYSVQARNTKKC